MDEREPLMSEPLRAENVSIGFCCPNCKHLQEWDSGMGAGPTADILTYDEFGEPAMLGLQSLCLRCEALVVLVETSA
jgi:hypothetical protein